MDERLEDIDKMLSAMDEDDHDSERELVFALRALDENDPASLNWLAACCAKRAGDLGDSEPS